jgi:phenylacetate-CoA ligase
MDTFYMNALMLADLVDRGGHEPVAIPALFILGTLEGAARKRLERIFGGEVFNRYSPHECEGIAVACSQHEGMHVAVDSYVVEITGDDGAPLAPEEVGHVVVTDLENMTMPLIRYAIGDLARWITAPCPCGRVFPRMSDLHGRQRDVLGTFRGHPVPPWAAERVLQGHPKIRFFQIVRTADGITISVVLAEGAPLPAAEIADLERRIEQLFAPPLPVRMVPVDRVPFEPNGKYRFVKNVMEDQDAI